MLKKILLVICGFFSVLCFVNANATIDRSHVTITNNTDEPISIHSTLDTDDNQFKKGTNWNDLSRELEPYESREVLWFERSVTVKNNHYYQFIVKATRANFSGENLIITFQEKAKSAFSSEVTANLVIPNQQNLSILTDKGLYQYPARIWKEQLTLHARRWTPTLSPYDDFHIVIDKPEVNTFPTPKNTQLSVLTYNTQLMPFYTGTVNDLNQPERRAHNIAKNIPAYDVVIMQELFDRDLRNIMSIDMKKNYPYHTRIVGYDTPLPLTGGVMIYSKWPIVKEDQIIYHATSGVDALAAKGVIYAAINKNGKIYHLFGTHAMSGVSDADVNLRAKEMAEFDNFILRMNIPIQEPILIGGDFNIDLFTTELQTILTTLHVNLPNNIGYKYSCDALVNLMHKGTDRNHLDYVFYGNIHIMPKVAINKVFILRALDDEGKWPKFDLSDHFPVAAYFDFST